MISWKDWGLVSQSQFSRGGAEGPRPFGDELTVRAETVRVSVGDTHEPRECAEPTVPAAS